MAEKSQKIKDPKRKPKYGMFSCVGYIYKILWKYKRWLAFTGILTVPVSLTLSAVTLYTPSLILNTLETSEHFTQIALIILGLLLAGLLTEAADSVLSSCIHMSEHYVLMRLTHIFESKMRYRDYFHSYQEDVQKLDERAKKGIQNNHSQGVQFPMEFSKILASILKFFLFGTIVSILHPLILLLLIAGCAIQYGTDAWLRKTNWSNQDTRNLLSKKMQYMAWGKGKDFRHGKDIRLYSMATFLHDLVHGQLKDYQHEFIKLQARNLLSDTVTFLLFLLRDGLAYLYLIRQAVLGEIDAAGFVLYFNAITSLSVFMNDILKTWSNISEGALAISDFREFLDLKDKLPVGPGIPLPTKPFSIEFQNVTYKYPQGQHNVLENISFKIEPGERIALVGLNGAGKTTLTLLMCGMLLPDKGTVLLNGHPVSAYNRDEMYSLFGFVPQNYNLLPLSIRQNITCTLDGEPVDEQRLQYCIQTAGLSEKINTLPAGMETPLDRELHEEGISLSGGEIQKLLLARLLYKNPLCMILDEPTAALDPIAEHRMYCKYNEIAAHATSVFISHRLASTRFCDRIFLLDGARFTETGTHEELMKKNGTYRRLFDVQSKYYQEGETADEP